MAGLLGKYHIALGDTGFLLSKDPRVGSFAYTRKESPFSLNRYGSGNPTYRDLSFWQYWPQIDWRNGEQQEELNDLGRYYRGENIDVTTASKLKLANEMQDYGNLPTNVEPIVFLEMPASAAIGLYCGGDDGIIYKYNSGTGDWDVSYDTSEEGVLCGSVRSVGTATPELLFGLIDTGGKAYIARLTNAGAWSKIEVAAAEAKVESIAEYNDTIYFGTGKRGRLYTSTDLATFTLAEDFDYPNYPGYVFDLTVYNGWLYAALGGTDDGRDDNYNGGIWWFDDIDWSTMYSMSGESPRRMFIYDSVMFMGTVNGKIHVYNTATFDVMYEIEGAKIVDFAEWDGKLFIAIQNSGSETEKDGIYCFDRNGLSRMFRESGTEPVGLVTCDNNLIAGFVNGVIKTIATDKYAASGYYQSSYYDAYLPTVDKLWNSVTVSHDALPNATQFTLYYRFDEDDSWVEVSTQATVGSKETLFELGDNVSSRKISLKLLIATTDNTVTPTVKSVVVRYILDPEVRYSYSMRVAGSDYMQWQDKTRPVCKLTQNEVTGATTLNVDDTSGMPVSGLVEVRGDDGSYSHLIEYSGKTETTLTGVEDFTGAPAGDYVLQSSRAMTKYLWDLKETGGLVEFTDIYGNISYVLITSIEDNGAVIGNDNNIEFEAELNLLEAFDGGYFWGDADYKEFTWDASTWS